MYLSILKTSGAGPRLGLGSRSHAGNWLSITGDMNAVLGYCGWRDRRSRRERERLPQRALSLKPVAVSAVNGVEFKAFSQRETSCSAMVAVLANRWCLGPYSHAIDPLMCDKLRPSQASSRVPERRRDIYMHSFKTGSVGSKLYDNDEVRRTKVLIAWRSWGLWRQQLVA